MSTQLPLSDLVDNAGLEFSIELAGDVFRFVFRYNDRDGRYYFDLYDEDDEPIALAVKVLIGDQLLGRIVDVRRPKGEIVVADVGAGAEPTLGTLGVGVIVLFVPWSESTAEDFDA